ncbi:uncharacterized protein BDR25DRAFT_223577 [Lindgomyces ingoldianus]|uniref:Uncharacterized protein n=1 Tax=Lindgomyces ingoldianus TaxID=673940 RepID=A0ACB6QY79_9PLEO|nr:uncharacterized protein BDR25DRAFT_223577 [Lindgomyces ingoldianus]KAF2471156.1 hypothetical protein BDR25DRAFT_223577 [Lindgomyces ingoldianus]
MSHNTSQGSGDLENQKTSDTTHVPFNTNDESLHDNPAFHRHAEATTAELFYDLFFVANLTTFTSGLEINDHNSLTAYVGFFSLLWLTWYQVSLYDVRFSADSVFERCAKAIHFGTMVGFAVIGPQWKPGQKIDDYKIYKAFGLILLVSRLTLVCQYGVTLFYTKKYTKTRIPLLLVMGSSLIAAILYGALTPAFPNPVYPEKVKTNVYIAWYIIGICEVLLTVSVSCIWRVISFKGTHMVQRMSLLTLIILGEGIIVICKSISKIVKNEFLWTAAVVGQIISAVLIIYFLYMLYFDRMQEDHFGSIKQQIWSVLHFPLHTVLVLVLQGISLLIIWVQAIDAFNVLGSDFQYVNNQMGNYTDGAEFATALNATAYNNVFYFVPKGVDATKEIETVYNSLFVIAEAYDFVMSSNWTNTTAVDELATGLNDLLSATSKTLFDSLSVTLPKKKYEQKLDLDGMLATYVGIFELVFQYVFIAGGLALILTTVLGFLSLPAHQRRGSEYIRLSINFFAGVGVCMIIPLVVHFGDKDGNYISSAWLIPTLCILFFLCVVINVAKVGKEKKH